ncbi:hypothetical protein Spith_0300 [Spirochaeta thermophila DSM 6578]|uniref:Uncharacterized protein n=1 Tax=Winmispira thermophila (strain ATCC 700085 / DSM 6578 / Z-1203) TaxID=869211 RepID=G0GDG0_WINT7|nr:hypothetical protein [Spirochaeta thermophila]AEJ60586.1 hypothetical protein Spith_0300 [Spirochaeta thermophila DSM 6578]
MKTDPRYARAYENMKPGVITAEGFLGDDPRPLADIIEADEEEFARLGLSFEEVAAKLKALRDEGKKGLGEPVTVEGKWLVRVDDARGHLPSPFEDGIFRKVNTEVTNLANGEKLVFTDLNLHLLERYHFLEGRGSPFRLEPERIKRVLEG